MALVQNGAPASGTATRPCGRLQTLRKLRWLPGEYPGMHNLIFGAPFVFNLFVFHMRIPSFLLSLSLLGAAWACKKKEPEPTTPTQLLTSRKWQLRSTIFSFPGAQDVEYFNLIRPCSRDDYQQFNLPNVLVTDEGAIRCSTALPQARTGTWALSNDDTRLSMGNKDTIITYTVLRLTSDSLKLSSREPQPVGIDATNTVIYTVLH